MNKGSTELRQQVFLWQAVSKCQPCARHCLRYNHSRDLKSLVSGDRYENRSFEYDIKRYGSPWGFQSEQSDLHSLPRVPQFQNGYAGGGPSSALQSTACKHKRAPNLLQEWPLMKDTAIAVTRRAKSLQARVAWERRKMRSWIWDWENGFNLVKWREGLD